ncbi:MAG: helix-turn-helix domain-containing protein [Flavobacteriaceae bacterium]|nr:MAG: helix-turn-helix domain-containing protein [Flavobacteriaceae bacterium]
MTPICNIRLCAEKPHRLPLPDPQDMSLGAELKRERLKREWSQKDTAKYFGVLKDSYQNWEWNKYIPHVKYRKKVVEFLGYNYWEDGTNSLSNKCLLYRIEYGLTMNELALQINVSTRTIERIENMEKNISSEMKNRIMNLLYNKTILP